MDTPCRIGVSEYLASQHELIRGTALEPILEPRRIQTPAGYHYPKCVAAGMFLLLSQGRMKCALGEPQVPTEITAHGIVYEVVRHGVATFFIRDEFARAVAATDLPSDFSLDDLHWPLAGMVVAFPLEFLREYLGREVCFVYAANLEAGEHHAPALAGCPAVITPKAKIGWQWYAMGDRGLESFVSSYFRGNRVNEAITNYGYTDYTLVKDQDGVEADRVATDRLSSLMLKLLVVLNTRPNLIERGSCIRPEKVKRGRVKHHALWSPNLIGWRYQPARSQESTGTHASPRMHWRRGHIRNQPHGPGRTLRRLIWLEPVLVGISVTSPKSGTVLP